jgi:beta-galactosidase
MREKINFDYGWKFHRGDLKTDFPVSKGCAYMHAKAERAQWGPGSRYYDDRFDGYDANSVQCTTPWENVRLPHDYVIQQAPEPVYNSAHGYFKLENAWYRKRFTLEDSDRNRRITLYFEGVSGQSTVYVNSCLVHRNFCGYTSFEVDITDIARFDEENVVAVYINTEEPEGWWYEGGGIYRHVWLVKTDLLSVDLWGVYVHPEEQAGDLWRVPVDITLRNDDIHPRTARLNCTILDADKKQAASSAIGIEVPGKNKAAFSLEMALKNPTRWDIDHPYQYTALVSVEQENFEIDRVETRFGFRSISFSPETGFILNGRPVKIKGVCCHGDYGLTGKAVPDRVQRYRIKLLKEMGANGYRTSHYPQGEATMDALDEAGFLVMDENRWFDSSPEGLSQLEMLVKRDRNRPGVIFWSVANEEPLHKTDMGRRITETMKAFVKALDNTRPVTAAISHDPLHAAAAPSHDVIGINYNLESVEPLHAKYPAIPVVYSECCATGTTRGWYLDDNPEKGYIFGYDRDTNASFLGREKTWKFILERGWICGEYQWAGIEHRGETAWPRLCSQSGALDLFLQKKDAFYQNQSHWSAAPMVHILPHWNHEGREGEEIALWVYTNCDEVELYQDGALVSRQKIPHPGHGEWTLIYKPGVLQARGYVAGKPAAEETVETTGPAAALHLELMDPGVRADGEDVAILACTCTDSQGRTVPDASPLIEFTCNGLGKILGTGSDICDHVPVSAQIRRMRAGKCALVVRTGEKTGTLRVYAGAQGLVPARLDIELEEPVKNG